MAEDCDHQTITLDDGRDVCPFCDDVPIETVDASQDGDDE